MNFLNKRSNLTIVCKLSQRNFDLVSFFRISGRFARFCCKMKSRNTRWNIGNGSLSREGSGVEYIFLFFFLRVCRRAKDVFVIFSCIFKRRERKRVAKKNVRVERDKSMVYWEIPLWRARLMDNTLTKKYCIIYWPFAFLPAVENCNHNRNPDSLIFNISSNAEEIWRKILKFLVEEISIFPFVLYRYENYMVALFLIYRLLGERLSKLLLALFGKCYIIFCISIFHSHERWIDFY